MKYIQLSLGLLVVVLCFVFAIVLMGTDLFEMENWRRAILTAVFIGYGLFRGKRVYSAFKSNQTL